jgi:hypothetical protein
MTARDELNLREAMLLFGPDGQDRTHGLGHLHRSGLGGHRAGKFRLRRFRNPA